jgi:PPOX class probable F420-dependent enzyme
MSVNERDLKFLRDNHSAAMITLGKDGMPKATRVGLCVVDGKVWSSGTEDRVRTRRLRRDPRCTLFVFDGAYSFLTLETTVTILDGPDAPQLNLRLFREMQGKPAGPLTWFGADAEEPEFLQKMVDEGRLIYEFAVTRAYGLH